MISGKAMWSLVGILNFLPVVAGAGLQAYTILRDARKALVTTGGILILGAFLLFDKEEVITSEDVSRCLLTSLIIGSLIFSMFFSKQIVVKMDNIVALSYTTIFWIFQIPIIYTYGISLLTGTLIYLPALLATIFAAIITIVKNPPQKHFMELVIYSWISVLLVLISILAYQEIATGFGNNLNLADTTLDWLSLFSVGAIYFYVTTTVMSVVLMLPIFTEKGSTYKEELQRAKEHRAHIACTFGTEALTSKKLIVVTALVGTTVVLRLLKAPDTIIFYVVITFTQHLT